MESVVTFLQDVVPQVTFCRLFQVSFIPIPQHCLISIGTARLEYVDMVILET